MSDFLLAAKLMKEADSLGAYQAVKYLSAKKVVRVTRLTWNRKIRVRDPVEFRLHIGRPNYLEVRHLEKCGEVPSQIQVRAFPKRRVS